LDAISSYSPCPQNRVIARSAMASSFD
jgi:hypothetical protein